MPVVVSEPESSPHYPLERAHTLSVSLHGGLIALRSNVNWGQSLTLTNPFSRVSQQCRVVYVGPEQQERRHVGIEFLGPVTNFWNISFPSPAIRPIGITA
jgi:hypothetical protein